MVGNEQSSRSSDPIARRPHPVAARPPDASGSRTIVIRQGGGWQSLAVFMRCLLLLAVVLLGPQALGRLDARAGRAVEAEKRLGAALGLAREADDPNNTALASCIAAALPGGDPAAAAKTLDELADKPWHVARMESRWWLWKATQDTAHLAESWRLLQHLREHAPEEYRETVINNVPLHRDIATAAQEAGL